MDDDGERATAASRPQRALVPPLRFACVDSDVYRGSYPKPMFAEFLARLELRTLVSITPEPIAPLPLGARVNYVHIPSAAEQQKSKKKRSVPISYAVVEQALAVITDPAAQPVFVHCLNGQQVTSLVVACLRVAQGWSARSALAEFARYGDLDRRDVMFVEAYDRDSAPARPALH